MGLENFVVFDDDSEVEAKPKKKPTPKKKPVPTRKKVEKEEKVVVKPQPKKNVKEEPIEEPKEVVIFASKYDREETLRTFKARFEKEEKLGKSVYETVYKGKKTILGSLIKSTDRILSVMMVMGDTILNSKFISVSPRFVAERELPMISKKFVSVNDNRRLPLLVEAKYMDSEHFPKHRSEVIEQFS